MSKGNCYEGENFYDPGDICAVSAHEETCRWPCEGCYRSDLAGCMEKRLRRKLGEGKLSSMSLPEIQSSIRIVKKL